MKQFASLMQLDFANDKAKCLRVFHLLITPTIIPIATTRYHQFFIVRSFKTQWEAEANDIVTNFRFSYHIDGFQSTTATRRPKKPFANLTV